MMHETYVNGFCCFSSFSPFTLQMFCGVLINFLVMKALRAPDPAKLFTHKLNLSPN